MSSDDIKWSLLSFPYYLFTVLISVDALDSNSEYAFEEVLTSLNYRQLFLV